MSIADGLIDDKGMGAGPGHPQEDAVALGTPRIRHYLALGLVIAVTLPVGVSSGFAAPAGDRVFTVANYPVEARAKDAVTAKDMAMTDGQQAAFRSLLKRIVPVTAYDRLKRVSGVKAANLVDGVSVRSESNSSTEYIANLDFSFQADGVRTILRREGVPFVDTQAGEITLVLVVRDGAQSIPQAVQSWTGAWKSLDLAHTLTPLKLEPLKPEVHADTIKMLTDGGGGADRVLKGEYKVERLLLAVADFDSSGRKLTVTLAGEDAVGPINWKRAYRMAPADHVYALELAAVVGLGVLEGRWKAVQAASRGGVDSLASGGAPVSLQVVFTSLGQWNDIRGQLLETEGVENVRIDGVSARSADVSLEYPGGVERLVDAMSARGLQLGNEGGVWILKPRF